ncbi:hypothetical protein ACFLIM_19455 [Nonomuraea sp. M3C6]|uniref:Uncharacterized protein n=1 Tax=Nonomuraea marmarensis TaxID=3351344 RepID=A0ABW7AG00_9ACTN
MGTGVPDQLGVPETINKIVILRSRLTGYDQPPIPTPPFSVLTAQNASEHYR